MPASEVIEDRGWSILSKSIIRHQDELVEGSIIDLSHLHSLQTRCETHVKVMNLSHFGSRLQLVNISLEISFRYTFNMRLKKGFEGK